MHLPHINILYMFEIEIFIFKMKTIYIILKKIDKNRGGGTTVREQPSI